MAGAAHTVGPNAIIQTLAAVGAQFGLEAREKILNRARLQPPVNGWRDMVAVDEVNALNRAVATELGCARGEETMREAGRRTGQYILENRIPQLAQTFLRMLPRRLSVRLFLKAIQKNAWTFAGHAHVQTGSNWIAIHDNPVCLGKSGFAGCVWHEAVFQMLFQAIIGHSVLVRETHCMGRGDPYCRFEIVVG